MGGGGGVVFKVRATRNHFGAKVAHNTKVDLSKLDPNLKVE
jgi:hypothetical protein